MSSINFQVIAQRLTATRLESYLQATNGDVEAAIRLYDWNSNVASALYEDLGRLEVVFRNAVDQALVRYGTDRGWPDVWFRRTQLFPGQHASRTRDDINAARWRATGGGKHPEVHGKVIAELSFGFWRYLCKHHHLTSLWVPAVASAFLLHPSAGDPRRIRSQVEDRMQRLHFLRNRIAHHEPIHLRNLTRNYENLLELTGWMCSDCRAWIAATSRTRAVIAARPLSSSGDSPGQRPLVS